MGSACAHRYSFRALRHRLRNHLVRRHLGEPDDEIAGGDHSGVASGLANYACDADDSRASLSDRTAETAIVPLDGAAILAKVDALPVREWRYKTESGVLHAGPMAQDFYAAFGVGEDDRHITSIDEDGITLGR